MKAKKNFMVAMFFAVTLLAICGLAGSASAANPEVSLTLSTYDPIPAEPGKTIDVWVNVQNTGNGDAEGIVVKFVDSAAFTIVSEEDREVTIPVLGAYKDYTIKYEIKVSENAADGTNNLLFKYTVGNIGSVEFDEALLIDVKSVETAISVTDIQLRPAPVEAGGKTTLSFRIENLAKSSSIRNVDVAIQITTVTSGTEVVTDLPFVTVNSGNEQSIDRIAAGQSGEFEFDLAVYPEAESKIYKLPVIISYYDDTGREYSKTILIGVEVNAMPDLLVTLDSADINSKVSSGDVLFNIINKGTSNVKLMTITLEETDQYEVLSPSSSLYLGNVDSDDFETARFSVLSKAKAGEDMVFLLKLEYKDSLNNEFVELYNVTYKMRAPASDGKGSFPWVLVIIIVAVVGFFWYRRKNKRK